MTHQDFWNKLWRDKQGKIVIWQNPNLPLVVWFVAMMAARLISQGKSHQLLDVVAFGAIFTWAYLEITSGANYFRRFVGLAVLVLVVLNRVG